MKMYRARPAAVDALIQPRRWLLIIVFVLATAVMLVAIAVITRHAVLVRGDKSISWVLAWFIVPSVIVFWIPLGLMMLMIMRSLRREHAGLASYVLEVTENELRRHQDGLVPRIVHRSEVDRISEGPWGIVVYTTSRDGLNIPRYLEGYDEVRDRLRAWRDLEQDTARTARIVLAVAIGIALVGAWATMDYGPTARWRVVGAIVSLAMVPWWIRVLLRELWEPDLPKRKKLALVFPIIVVTWFSITALFVLLHDMEELRTFYR